MLAAVSPSTKMASALAAALAAAVLLAAIGSELYLSNVRKGQDAGLREAYQSQVQQIRKASRAIVAKQQRDRVDLKIESRDIGPIEDGGVVEPMAGDTSFVLTGISWTDERPLAFLNGKIVTAGAMVGGAKVLEVLRDRVRIEQADGEKIVVTIRR